METREQNFLIITEHNPVITIGKSATTDNIVADPKYLMSLGIDIIKTDRGGDITFHGPGQIIGYPILNLLKFEKDIYWYLRQLEQVVINTLANFKIQAKRIDGLTGIWVNDRKICAIGVKITRWVTMHGFALNVSTNLDYFKYIIPCGISDKGVASISDLVGNNIDIKDVRKKILNNFEIVFNVEIVSEN
jgi:lipoyl(octanoyl) transferase